VPFTTEFDSRPWRCVIDTTLCDKFLKVIKGHLKHGSDVCDGTTNQTNRLSHQQRQNSTVNIFNIQLYTFIITFRKHKFIQKIKKWRQEYKNTKYDHDKLYDLRTDRIKLMNWIQYNKLLNKKIKTLKLNESFITV
jgi:hypothetical protein